MDDFRAGVPNMFGLVGNEANTLPHKRMLSSMTPTIVERTESFYDRWFPWRFDDYYFCAANDIECIRIHFSMQEAVNAPISPSMVTRSDFRQYFFNTNL
jgi:gamma-glutamyltranspeptidase/glutathione hydrolase